MILAPQTTQIKILVPSQVSCMALSNSLNPCVSGIWVTYPCAVTRIIWIKVWKYLDQCLLKSAFFHFLLCDGIIISDYIISRNRINMGLNTTKNVKLNVLGYQWRSILPSQPMAIQKILICTRVGGQCVISTSVTGVTVMLFKSSKWNIEVLMKVHWFSATCIKHNHCCLKQACIFEFHHGCGVRKW